MLDPDIRTRLLISACFCLIGCNQPKPVAKTQATQGTNQIYSSSVYVLSSDECREFVVGRPQDEILKNIDGKGIFLQAAVVEGRHVTASMYSLFGDIHSDDGVWVWAIFEEGRFRKFVKYAALDSSKRVQIGALSWLVHVAKGDPVNIEDLENEETPTYPVDWGLTAVFLLHKEGLEAADAKRKAAKPHEYRRNDELRKQFSAARLRLGMTASEVESAFNAKPLETGTVQGRYYQVYGSDESLLESVESDSAVYYFNVLVVFRESKAIEIYGVPGGKDSLRKLREMFSGFPPLPAPQPN